MTTTHRMLITLLLSTAGSLLILTACTQHAADPEEQAKVEEQEAELERVQVTGSRVNRADTEQSMQDGRTAGQSANAPPQLLLRERTAADKAMPSAMTSAIYPSIRMPSEPLDRENYAHMDDNPVHLVSEDPVSTFSMDVDTGSYSNIRRMLNAGQLPPMDAVRIEEMINYFDYAYEPSRNVDRPFSSEVTLSRAPWDQRKGLLRIGIKGYEIERDERQHANLVFLVDVSGSMQSADKLELLKKGLGLLSRQLTADDRVSLVVYAGASGVILQPTPGNQGATIRNALDQLVAGGSTNGASGIRLAYDMAEQAYIKEGINRVILATDGDFNVGTVNFEALVDLVERERESGITLTTLGFGTGNYNDRLMEQLADKGNGNYAYIDTVREADKVLVENLTSTLQVIAKDVKAQIEFNPAVVKEYRLVGYENRVLAREDFNNDKVDAGDIGAGHTVTALYEIVFAGSDAGRIDPLRYGNADAADEPPLVESHDNTGELGYLKLRYKLPDESSSRLIQQVVANDIHELDDTDADFRFAASVAAFGQQLRSGKHSGGMTFSDIRALATSGRGEDSHGYRGEFLGLVELAESLQAPRQAQR